MIARAAAAVNRTATEDTGRCSLHGFVGGVA
jgi:hypothetical protein